MAALLGLGLVLQFHTPQWLRGSASLADECVKRGGFESCARACAMALRAPASRLVALEVRARILKAHPQVTYEWGASCIRGNASPTEVYGIVFGDSRSVRERVLGSFPRARRLYVSHPERDTEVAIVVDACANSIGSPEAFKAVLASAGWSSASASRRGELVIAVADEMSAPVAHVPLSTCSVSEFEPPLVSTLDTGEVLLRYWTPVTRPPGPATKGFDKNH